MKKSKVASLLSLFVIGLASCSSEPEQPGVNPDPTPTPPSPVEKIEIRISPTYESRATDYGFEQNDRIGLYVVNYEGTTAGSLKNTGNHVDNMGFTYSGSWTADTPIYWKDETSHADFYLYYPYSSQISSVSALAFDVKADQSNEAAYKASDLMIGRAKNVAPTSSAISIPVSHVMSRITVKVEAGNGFTAESLAASDIAVKVNGLKCKSTVDLATSAITPAGEAVTVTPLVKSDSYTALIVPQTVEEGNLITVNVDGRDFNLKKGFTFESGKNHTFTVVVSKTSNGINVDINPWQNDGTDNGGVAE
ncbi:MAG: fimbrillin family protein [Muribaculaceae bacterium]|nr:fimbrillin family protein [Muribaculaceae bacterium]